MAEIFVLDSNTIDQIAAGEVVERPASIVKELVENAMDAGARAVTVEIKDGGRTFIRVTDNGGGIGREQVRKAFYRHATSKIRSIDDLFHVKSLGFRGEALSSIAAVSMVELITKTPEQLTGVHFSLEGDKEKDFSEIGAPDGTTIIVRELFFNTPARKKFLKSAVTEASYISDLMEHLALSRPDVAFQFILNGQVKFHTSGNGALKEIVYRIYGRDISKELIPFHANKEGLCVDGFLGSPSIVRANRNFEFFFVNGRYIRSGILTKGVEAGYKAYLMRHRFPFALFHLKIAPEMIDVNVHPAKMEIRFHEEMEIYGFLEAQVRGALQKHEMIPDVRLDGGKQKQQKPLYGSHSVVQENAGTPGPDSVPAEQEAVATDTTARQTASATDAIAQRAAPPGVLASIEPSKVSALVQHKATAGQADGRQEKPSVPPLRQRDNSLSVSSALVTPMQESAVSAQAFPPSAAVPETAPAVISASAKPEGSASASSDQAPAAQKVQKEAPQPFEAKRIDRVLREEEALYGEEIAKQPEQLNLFEEKILSEVNIKKYRILGQAFATYWIAQYEDKLLFIDQHAAHEKVKYEALMKKLRERKVDSQVVTPPVILSLAAREEHLLQTYRGYFKELGFEIEDFGSGSYAVRSVPCDLFGHDEKEFLEDILDELDAEPPKGTPAVIEEKLASMACKSAVKGNHPMSLLEMENLLGQLLSLDNPYHCPHGRPTMITMSRYELERKFKRII